MIENGKAISKVCNAWVSEYVVCVSVDVKKETMYKAEEGGGSLVVGDKNEKVRASGNGVVCVQVCN